MALRLPKSTNLKAYISHFRPVILIVIAVLIIVGVVAGVYSIGKHHHDSSDTKTTANHPEVTPQKIANQAAGSGTSSASQSNSSNSTQHHANIRTTPNTGPGTTNLANTGPGGYSVAAILLVSILIYYRHSRFSLIQSWRQAGQ